MQLVVATAQPGPLFVPCIGLRVPSGLVVIGFEYCDAGIGGEISWSSAAVGT